MGTVHFVLGGARSGKSTYAEDLCKQQGGTVAYIATAVPFDAGMKARIQKHREQRPATWATIERHCDFQQIKGQEAYREADVVILDCITVMVTNLMLADGVDFDQLSETAIDAVEASVQREVDALLALTEEDKTFVFVSNEVGLGLVPPYKMGSVFRDIAGRVNQKIAKHADNVYFVVSGIPMKIK